MSSLLIKLTFVLGLTFLLSIISFLLLFVEKRVSSLKGISQYSYLVWFIGIFIFGVIGGKDFSLSLPINPANIEFSEIIIILAIIWSFAKYSDYTIHSSIKPFIVFTLVFPIGEEILFRGVLQSSILSNQYWGVENMVIPGFGNVPTVVFISAICFGITHVQYNGFKIDSKTIKQVLFAFVFGVYAGKMVVRTESILYPLLLHSFANLSVQLYGLSQKKKHVKFIAE